MLHRALKRIVSDSVKLLRSLPILRVTLLGSDLD
jgi:hypothetical protein